MTFAVSENRSPVAARSDFLAMARDLSSLIEQEAPAIEAACQLTPPVINAFRDTGLFWMNLPRDMRGGGAGLVEFLEVIEEVSCADGSTGWSFMATAGCNWTAAIMLGDGALDSIFGGRELSLMAGMLGPAGQARAVDGGYIGGGRFQFGSGIAYANWVGGGFLVMDEGKPLMGDNGQPVARVGFVSRDQVDLLGNWQVTGMVGTGSFDYQIREHFIPADFTYDRAAASSLRDRARFSGGPTAIGSVSHAGVALGLMKRALQEVVRIASSKKRPGQSRFIADGELFRYEFGLNESMYQAARDLTVSIFQEMDDAAATGIALSPGRLVRHRQVVTWLHKVAADVVRFAHLWCGSETVRNTTPMSRVSRDMAVITQHVWVDPKTIVDAAPTIFNDWIRKGIS